MSSFKRILVPTDFGDAAERALDAAIGMAERFDAELTVVHVHEGPDYAYAGVDVTPADYLPAIRKAAQAALNEALDTAQQRLPRVKGVLLEGRPWQRILSATKELQAHLIVMGTHGRRGLSHAFMGSVAEKVVRQSPVPVLTIRAAKAPDAGPG